ncbi:MAG: type II secretion system F family protein [Nanopusillaceae archaeon]
MKNIAPDPELYEKFVIFGYSIRQEKFILLLSIFFSVIILIFGIFFKLYINYITLAILIILVYFISAFPYIFYKTLDNQKKNKILDEYISFLRSLSESLSSGMTLQQALKNISDIGYSELGKFIKKLYVWISWGIDFKKAFEMFNSYFRDNKEIRRANAVILETYIAGGDFSKTLKSVADDIESIRELEKFRISYLRQQVLVMYIVYVVFIGLLIGILQILKPMMVQFSSNIGGFGVGFQTVDIKMMKNVLSIAIIMEALSIGIINGYIESNRISSSFKHIAITLSIAIISIVLFILPPLVNIEINIPAFNTINDLIEIKIKIYVDMKPLENNYANINIIGPESIYDRIYVYFGEASYIFVPKIPGTYEITVSINYMGNNYKESRKITVS